MKIGGLFLLMYSVYKLCLVYCKSNGTWGSEVEGLVERGRGNVGLPELIERGLGEKICRSMCCVRFISLWRG